MKAKKMALCAVCASLVFLATAFISIRSPFGGYFHLGDAVILGAAALLGPIAAIPAAVGSVLADIYMAAPIYVLPTAVIKGLLGMLAGAFIWKKERGLLITGLFFLCAEAILVAGGYFLYECIVFTYEIAVLNILGTGAQVAVGALGGLYLSRQMKKAAKRLDV